jgi:hypothetical protein
MIPNSQMVYGISGKFMVNPADINKFIIRVKTNNTGVTTSTQFRIPLFSGKTYNALIEWGDGTTTTQTTDVSPTHTYPIAGIYQIKISGTFPAMRFNNGGDRSKVVSLDNWGNIQWTTMDGMFYGCGNMVSNYSNQPDTSLTTSMLAAFRSTKFNSVINFYAPLVTTIERMLSQITVFNSSVRIYGCNSTLLSTREMFNNCVNYNSTLNIDSESVIDMFGILDSCSKFNQPFNLNTQSCQELSFAFFNNLAFNQTLGHLNVSNLLTAQSFLVGNISMTPTNVDNLYNGWSSQILINGTSLQMGTLKYTSAGLIGRNILTNSPNDWFIEDGGIV